MLRNTLVLWLALGSLAWGQVPPPEQRAVVLQATRNTRDMGGLPVKGGTIRSGMLFRSGALCFLTPGDVDRINSLKLKTLVELRVAKEIAHDGPDRATIGAGERVTLPMHNSRGIGQEAYHFYIRENPEAIRDFFALVSQRQSYPLLFHCSAGKDRTGILACLLLWSLGAERSVIEDDYLQSQRNAPKLVVKPEWIDEVFKYVEECGGIQAFLTQAGVSADEVERIRAILVDSP